MDHDNRAAWFKFSDESITDTRESIYQSIYLSLFMHYEKVRKGKRFEGGYNRDRLTSLDA